MSLAILDTKFCNLNSVVNALEFCGMEFSVISKADEIDKFKKILLPGVGAFDHAMNYLNLSGLSDAIRKHVTVNDGYIFGICLGMQLLGTFSDEGVGAHGLDLIGGHVKKLPNTSRDYRVPNIGWCETMLKSGSKLFSSLDNRSSYYYVHSYHYVPDNENNCCAKIDFCDQKVCVGVENNNIFGVQFHPEKSYASGLSVLKNFYNL